MHVLTQDEDAQGYADGLDDWTCSCGLTFSATEIPEAYQHGYETAPKPSDWDLMTDDPKAAQEKGY